MNATIQLGMDIPELDLINFTDEQSGKLDTEKYFDTLFKIAISTGDMDVYHDVLNRYLKDRFAESLELHKAYAAKVIDLEIEEFPYKIKDAFELGKFYTTNEIKNILNAIYTEDYGVPIDFSYKKPLLLDLTRYSWFKYKYAKINTGDGMVTGVILTECLIPEKPLPSFLQEQS